MTRVEREIIAWGKLLFERRLISGWGGNISCRVSKDRFLITGQHTPLGFLTAEDIVPIDRKGKPLRKHQQASSETPMHLAVYKGTDAQAIVHAHPPTVVAYSLLHQKFVPFSFEEKFTLGTVSIISQDTPTVTKPQELVEELKYNPAVIIRGHGTVAIGRDLREAFLFTDLLEVAVRCQSFKDVMEDTLSKRTLAPERREILTPARSDGGPFVLFSREHISALVDSANRDSRFREYGRETGLTGSLTLHMEENNTHWTVEFSDGEITGFEKKADGDFLISGKKMWWEAVFNNRIDPFFATQQEKLKLKRGELAQLSRWYKPFQRAFSIWQTIPTQ